LREKGLERVKVYMGGVMAPEDAVELERDHGVHKVFLPDTPMETIVTHMYESLGRSRHRP
jgi:methylmalonyl-CoA mutase cobalamin-binding domain/chain